MRKTFCLVGSLVCIIACRDDVAPPPAALPAHGSAALTPAEHPTAIARPSSLGGLDTAFTEISGTSAAIGCRTCHDGGSTEALATREGAPRDFHGAIPLNHGGLVCASCHVLQQPHELHLADGTQLPIEEAMTLCGQCHGAKMRAYQHGAHGGMRGYWDLASGPRERNDCVTCHTPHQPAYPRVLPAPGPRDRFAHPRRHGGSHIESRFGGEHE